MADWVIVVDDDEANLRIAGFILSKANMRVTAMKSGEALLDFIRDNDVPDLILLDIKMHGMDGFETLTELRQMEKGKDIPVIFLTADETDGTEEKGLSLGAMDFIKKPFIPEVLTIRVRHMINLDHFQKDLANEVEKKTRENKKLFLHVVSSLAAAIDAKDTYTNGHSSRVAQYAQEIAMRAGIPDEQLENIYMTGLLHDVGKIGVPDAVINKPAKLTDEEYEIIRNHPVLGARILGNIKEMPLLQSGARWHHERYDGKGYPDGLAGEDIPETARIIAVADSYDAMTSYRSYRNPLPQGIVKDEIEKGMGTQFDPAYAKIMLEMIEEDTEYTMREGKEQ
ncbi:MAG: response regulator [Lachnospiraceae bacterium]|nr:response regulator [Lachnospiraceae bacterium]